MGNIQESIINLEYNGKKTDKITNESDSFTFTDNASKEADTVSIGVSNYTGKYYKDFFPGKEDYIKAWISLSGWTQGKKNRKLYCGKFQVDSMVLSGWPQRVQIKGISIPIGTNFNVTQKNRTWKKTNTKSILGDLARNARISLVYDANIFEIEEISQSGQTDLSFAFNLCSEYDLSLKLYNDKMIIYDQTKYEKRTESYTIKKSDLGGKDAFAYSEQITTLYDSVKIQYSSSKHSKDQSGNKTKTLTYSYVIPGKKGKRTLFVTAKASSYKEAEIKAKAKLRENLRGSKELTLKVMGDTRYKAAECFALSGFGKLDGKYFIDQVQHDKSGGKYTCTIVSHPVVIDF